MTRKKHMEDRDNSDMHGADNIFFNLTAYGFAIAGSPALALMRGIFQMALNQLFLPSLASFSRYAASDAKGLVSWS